MGKLALIAVVVFSTIGALTTMNRQGGFMDASETVADKQYEVLARNAALAGMNRAKQALADGFHDQSFEGSADGVPYVVKIAVSGDNAVIKSVGTADGSGGDVDYQIRTQFTRVYSELPVDPPAFMDFAILSELDLILRGNIEGMLEVTGENASQLNANMHTNANLTLMGNAASVQGFGTYVASASGKLGNAFNPNYNPTGLPDAYQADPIDIPIADVTTWAANAMADQTSSSTVVLSGAYSMGGTRENPYVWVINGDLNVASDATFEGYNMFIVDGNVEFNGNMTVSDSGYDGALESSMAVYASGSINFAGNEEIEAQLYAGGDVIFGRGTPILRGSITTQSGVEFRGTADIFYRPASPALTTNWVPRESSIQMTGYHEK